ncbi:MAG: hypothetical protein GX130_08680 [Candidatus Hydrogenedens sp.]|jgi:serine/threonine protein kinase|nr:hypothetical protein [Candidatus Hydrogenedens sp.]
MSNGRVYSDNFFQRKIIEFHFKGRVWRFPHVLAERFEIKSILTVSGFGVLLTAQDRKIFNRRVLVKTGFLEDKDLLVRNNAALPDLVAKVNVRYGMERNLLLHGQMRKISGIPILIDWLKDINPTIRGPHQAQGQEFYHEDPACWQEMVYLVLSFFDGVQLDEFCGRKLTPHQITNKPTEYFSFVARYLVKTLQAFHRETKQDNKQLHFIYQDLKPANIMISPKEKRYCLIDFGGVAARSSDDRILNGGVFTEEFAPPEAKAVPLNQEKAVAPTWDIYTIGMTLKHCIKLSKVKVSKTLTDILDKCTEDKPKDRFQTLDELWKDLSKVK